MKRLILALLLPALAGCQTVERGTSQVVRFTAVPVNAHCRLTGPSGARDFDTPATLTLPRAATVYRLVCAAPGLHSEQDFGPKKVDSYGQTGPGDPTLPFRVVDMATGAYWVFPDTYEIILLQVPPPAPGAPRQP